MSDDFRYWTHGVAVQVEYPDNVKSIRRAGWGTDIVQAQGTENWFHFAIPTPTRLDDDNVDQQGLYLLAKIDNKATIDEMSCHRAGEGRLKEWNVSYSATTIGADTYFDIPNQKCTKPLVLCIHVKFDGPGDGMVTFYGAGGNFEEHT